MYALLNVYLTQTSTGANIEVEVIDVFEKKKDAMAKKREEQEFWPYNTFMIRRVGAYYFRS